MQQQRQGQRQWGPTRDLPQRQAVLAAMLVPSQEQEQVSVQAQVQVQEPEQVQWLAPTPPQRACCQQPEPAARATPPQ